jgi:hypothetical protein
MSNSKRLIKRWFIVASVIPAMGLLNYVVDPYGFRDSSDKYISNLVLAKKSYTYPNKIYSDFDIYMIGTSRVIRLSPTDIEKYVDKKCTNINISGALFRENYYLVKKLKEMDKNFIYGFDLFSLNKSLEKTEESKSRYKVIKDTIDSDNIINRLPSLINNDLIEKTFNHLGKKFSDKPLEYFFDDEDARVYDFDIKSINSKFDMVNTQKKKHFSEFKFIDNGKIKELATLATSDDIFVIYPKHYYYYKEFAKYQNLERDYFEAIKVLVKNTKAKVYSYYGINSFTIDKNNFDGYGWHFKPKVGKEILKEIYTNADTKIGTLLTKDNVDEVLNRVSIDIKNEEIK